MRKIFIVTASIFLLATNAQATTINATVDGLVCAFCATGLEKTFKKQAPVETVKVDLESKLVTLTTKPKKDIDDATVTKLITAAGFTVTNIARVE